MIIRLKEGFNDIEIMNQRWNTFNKRYSKCSSLGIIADKS